MDQIRWNWWLSISGVSTPLTQATAVEFYITGPTVMTLRWTNGNGTNRIVLMKAGGAVSSTPSDSTTYTANTTFGSGTQLGSGNYTVYNGTGSEVSVTGLSENTTYHVRVFEYNGSAGSEKYNTATASGNPASDTTFLDVFQYATAAWEFESNILNSTPDPINHGSSSANISYSAGKHGNAINFTGTNSYVFVPNSMSLSATLNNTTDRALAVEFWAKPTNLSGTRWLVSKRTSNSEAEWQIHIDVTTGKINLLMFSQAGVAAYLHGTTDIGITAGVYSHIVCVFDPSLSGISRLAIYINGVSRTLTNNSVGSYVRQTNTPALVNIGGQGFAPTGSSGFVGQIDSCRVYQTALTSGQITQLYNSGNGVAYDFNYDWMTQYRLYSYILATNGNYVLAYDYATSTKLWWSEDRGKTWLRSYTWGSMFTAGNLPVYNKWVNVAHIFDNGTAIWGTPTEMFRSTDGLQNVTSPSIQGRGYLWTGNDSDAFVFHTPVDPTRPGSYFGRGASPPRSQIIDGQEVVSWSNYANVGAYALGAAPIFQWACKDNGATIQAVHCWGQHPAHRDNGGTEGGSSGTFLGNASNLQVCRHGHDTAWIPGTSDFLVTTGDFAGATPEIHWLRMSYNISTGLLSAAPTNLIVDNPINNRYFGVGLMPSSDGVDVTWSTDVPIGGTASEQGIWKNAIASLSGKTGETRLKDLGDKALYSMIIANDKAIVTGEGGELDTQFAVVDSSGSGAVSYKTAPGKLLRTQILVRQSPPDSKNFVKMDLGGFDTAPLGTILYKVS